MGDAGEGLIDAEDRFQQWVAEREQQKQRKGVASADPERDRKLNSLRLAKAELERQQAVTTSEIRREQIRQALVEIERQLESHRRSPQRFGVARGEGEHRRAHLAATRSRDPAPVPPLDRVDRAARARAS